MVAPTSKNRYVAPQRGRGGGRGGGGDRGGGSGGAWRGRGGGRGGGRRDSGGLYKRGADGRQEGSKRDYSEHEKKRQGPAKVLKPRLDKNGKPIKESFKWGLDRVAFHLYKQSGKVDDKTSLIPKKFRKSRAERELENDQSGLAPSGSDRDESAPSEPVFGRPDGKPITMADLAERTGIDPEQAQFLNLANMKLGKLPDLGACARLTRLDAAGNGLHSVQPIAPCRDLTWLSLKDNRIKDLAPLKRHFRLEVLTLSVNEVETLEPLAKILSLKALIANNNTIASMAGLAALSKINTLVLSHNAITAIEGLQNLKLLKKLSLAHNQIRVIPDLRDHPLLEELRLNNNKIQRVPETIDRCPALKVLDLGKNRLYDIADLFRLAQCRKILNLNLAGNARLNDLPGYRDKALASCPQLQVLDNKKVMEEDDAERKKRQRKWSDPSRSTKFGKDAEGEDGGKREGESKVTGAGTTAHGRTGQIEAIRTKVDGDDQARKEKKRRKKEGVDEDFSSDGDKVAKEKKKKEKRKKKAESGDEERMEEKEADEVKNPFDKVLIAKTKQATFTSSNLTEKMSRVVELGDGWEIDRGKGNQTMNSNAPEHERDSDVEDDGIDLNAFAESHREAGAKNDRNKSKSGMTKGVEHGKKRDAVKGRAGFQAGVLPAAVEVAMGGESAWE